MAIIDSIVCFIKGHDLQYATYAGAFPTYAPPTISYDAFGIININKRFITGFMHYGLISKCERCGKIIDADNLKLPIIEPKFDD